MGSLIPWRKSDLESGLETSMKELRREMDDMFSSFLGRRWISEPEWVRQFVPAFDISETDTEFRINAELPGVEPKDVEVNLTGDVLTIKGEKREEHEEKGGSMHTLERKFGSFSRSFRLPTEVEADKVEAVFKDGVLTLKLPKAHTDKKKSIKIDVK